MTAPDLGDLGEVVAYIRGQQLLADPAGLYRRLTALEARMSLVDDQIAAITANLENLRGDVTRLNALAVELQGEIAAQDPATAARLQPLVDLSAEIAGITPEPAEG